MRNQLVGSFVGTGVAPRNQQIMDGIQEQRRIDDRAGDRTTGFRDLPSARNLLRVGMPALRRPFEIRGIRVPRPQRPPDFQYTRDRRGLQRRRGRHCR